MVRRFKLILFAAFCFVVAGQFVWTNAEAQEPAEKFFKNIKALKGVPQSQIGALMDSYNKALGVGCNYCHVAGDLPNDSKPEHKATVRDIMMTREINDKYHHRVDCMSCHQGKAKPTTTVLATNTGGPTAGPTTNPTTPTTTNPTTTKPDKTPPPATAGSGEPPTKVNYPTSYSGTKVLFPHDTHMSLDCSKCHHTGDNTKCDTCHLHNKKVGDVTKVTFYALSHDQKSERACWGCHVKSSAGPRTCAGCHKK